MGSNNVVQIILLNKKKDNIFYLTLGYSVKNQFPIHDFFFYSDKTYPFLCGSLGILTSVPVSRFLGDLGDLGLPDTPSLLTTTLTIYANSHACHNFKKA